MWVRQCELDAGDEGRPPIPARIASNEEFVPPPQSPEQKEYEARLADLTERAAQSAGQDPARRSSAPAAAWPPRCWPSTRSSATATTSRPTRSTTRRPSRRSGPRTSSSSTCRPTTSTSAASGTTTPRPAARSSRFFERLRPGAKTREESLELLNRAHYVKEIFGDSDTVMAIISGVPSRDWDKNPLPPDQMVATRAVRQRAGRLAPGPVARPAPPQPRPAASSTRWSGRSRSSRSTPGRCTPAPRSARRPGSSTTRRSPTRSGSGRRKLGIKNLCVHKGLPLGVFNEKACTPLDVEKAAKDWPDLNFIIYHSGFRGFGSGSPGARGRRSSTPRPTTRRRSPGSATSSAS